MNSSTQIIKPMHLGSIVLVVILMISMGQSVNMYVPAMPALIQVFNTSPMIVESSITVALIGFSIAIVIMGPFADFFGRRKTALMGIGLFFCGSIICTFAQNIGFFLLGRAIQGLGVGSTGAVCPSIPNDRLKGSELVKAYSYISLTMAITPLLAPVLGSYLQEYLGLQAIFILMSLYSFIIFFFFYLKLPETNAFLKQNTYSVKQVCFNYLEVLNSSKAWGFFLCLMTIFSGEIAYCISLPFLVQQTLGYSIIFNGWLMIATALGLTIGALSSSRLTRIYSIEQLLGIGITFTAIGAVLMCLFAWNNQINIYVIIIPMFIYVIGTGIVYPNCIGGVMSLFPKISGAAGSLLGCLQMLGAGIASTLIANSSIQNQKPLAFLLLFATIFALMSYVILIKEISPRNLINLNE